MAWSTIRKATETDTEKLEAAAVRFCNRHGIEIDRFDDGETAVQSLESHIDAVRHGYGHFPEDATRLENLWKRVTRRALDSPNADGIAYGYVGCHAQ